MKLKATLSFLLLLVSLHASAIKAHVAHTVFFTPEANGFSPYLDLYWEIEAPSLAFKSVPGNILSYAAQLQVDITLSNDTGVIMQDHFIMQTPAAATQEAAEQQTILDLRRYALSYGKLKADVAFTEVGNPTNRYNYSNSFTVAQPGVCFSSELQLLDTAYRSKLETQFQRNGMQHIPLCVHFIDNQRAALNYYYEIYGLDKVKGIQPYILKTFISKKINENALAKYIRTDTLRDDAVVPKYGSYDISTLGSGNYYLNVSVFDNENNKLAGSSLYFQRANKDLGKNTVDNDTASVSINDTISKTDVATLDLGKTFVGKFSHPQLVAILKMLLPIADDFEKMNIQGFLDKPDEMYTRYFVYNFWLNKDPDKPEKAWEAYADKVREINKMFGGSMLKGYETDRGYTYLKYGKPNERIIITAEQGALPYEIWQYFTVKTQGRDGVFLFYRPDNMVNDYKVLHTTVTGEAKDLNWRMTLYPRGRNQLIDSKAEEYLRNR